MRSFVFLLLIFVSLPSFAAADFPFEITRSDDGKIQQIILPQRGIVPSATAIEMINEIQAAYEQNYGSAIRMQSVAEQLQVPAEHRDELEMSNSALMTEIKSKDFDDPRLVAEFAKAQKELGKAPFFRLLADPTKPEAFDEEKSLELAIDVIFKAADQVLPAAPLFKVFQFLVDEYVEALMSRREFYQNHLVFLLQKDIDNKVFSTEEKNAILSSIYYSRLSLLRPDKRAKARKKWDTFGLKSYNEEFEKCEDFTAPGDIAFGPCFKVIGHKINNRLVKKNLLNKKPSIAFNYDHPKSVRNYRIMVLLVKLGSKIAPIPSPGGSVFRKWLSSLYKNQRRSEGYLYAHFMDQGDENFSRWILFGSANPLINR